MRYITGIHALNLPCSLETCGDWHTSALRWKDITIRESDNSIFKDYGIEECSTVPENPGTFYIANTLRALLDLLTEGNYGEAQGANNDFICNDKYTEEFFNQVYKLRKQNNWKEIDRFMQKEYLFEWDRYKEKQNVQ